MKQITSLFIIFLSISCKQNDPSAYNQVIGVYEIYGFGDGIKLELTENKQFSHENSIWGCMGGGRVRKINGTYRVEDGKVTLNPTYVINEILEGRKPYTITSRDSLPFRITDTLYIIKDYTIFTWDSLTYLFREAHYNEWGYHREENDYERLANDYNAGYKNFFNGPYFFKGPKENPPQSKLQIDQLPPRYEKRFLKEPITGEILQSKDIEIIEYNDPRIVNQYVINRGRKDGIMEKMRFYGIDGKCQIRITQVNESTCVGWSYKEIDYPNDCIKGCRVSTSWIGSKEEKIEELERLEMMKDPALKDLIK
ncbi:MAG: hypothetical protein HYZ44_14620 [Bacteroidetes bacterium]|nr:hypothetical protein [Bacteroidota bacterium]